MISFAKYSLFHRALLQKRPMILRSLLIVATPYKGLIITLFSLDSLCAAQHLPNGLSGHIALEGALSTHLCCSALAQRRCASESKHTPCIRQRATHFRKHATQIRNTTHQQTRAGAPTSSPHDSATSSTSRRLSCKKVQQN